MYRLTFLQKFKINNLQFWNFKQLLTYFFMEPLWWKRCLKLSVHNLQ